MSDYKRYTREELLSLRNSPLAQKPDRLPPIEQWMDVVKSKDDPLAHQRQKRPSTRPEDGETNLLGRFSSAPSLPTRRTGTGISARGNAGQGAMGDFSLFPSSSSNDDLALGPPLMNFTSNSRNMRGSEGQKGDKGGDFQEGFFKMTRGMENSKDKSGALPNNQRRPRESKDNQGQSQPQQQTEDGWTNVRRRKSHAEEEKSGAARWDDRDRTEVRRAVRDAEPTETSTSRRNGAAKGRFTDSSWIRPENANDTGDREQTSTSSAGARADVRNMSWRERDASIKDRPNREWARGRQQMDSQSALAEEDPEWMVDDSAGQAEKQKHTHTQEDFQRWKEQQRLREQMKHGHMPAPPEKDIGDLVEDNSAFAKPVAPGNSKSAGVIPTMNRFGGFGFFEEASTKKTEAERPEAAAAQRPPLPKAKSRFEQLFNKKDDEIPQLPAAAAVPDALSSLFAQGATGSAEDKAGFERILAMLGSKSTPPTATDARGPPPQDLPRGVASPTRHMQKQSREKLANEPRPQREQFMEEVFANQLAAQERNQLRQQQMTPELGAMLNRGVAPPQVQNQTRLQEMQMQFQQMGMQNQGTGRQIGSREEFLLNLMNQQLAPQHRMNELPDLSGPQYGPPKNGMPAQQQQQQQLPPHSQAQGNNQRQAPSAPPPGLEPHQQRILEQHREEMRRQQLHGIPPPGFFDHEGMPNVPMAGHGPLPDGMVAPPPPGLARRNTADGAPNGGHGGRGPAPAQASNLGIPSIHGGPPPGMARMDPMLLMRNGAGPGSNGPMQAGPGGHHHHHLPPPGLMHGGAPPPGHNNGPLPSAPQSAGPGNNQSNGPNAERMRGPGGPGLMGPPHPGFQGGMLPPGLAGPNSGMPPMNMNMQGMGPPGNGPPMPPNFSQMGPPPGFYGGPMGPIPNGPNGPIPSGPGMGPGMPPPGAFFGGRFPPGFEAEMNRQVPPQGRGF